MRDADGTTWEKQGRKEKEGKISTAVLGNQKAKLALSPDDVFRLLISSSDRPKMSSQTQQSGSRSEPKRAQGSGHPCGLGLTEIRAKRTRSPVASLSCPPSGEEYSPADAELRPSEIKARCEKEALYISLERNTKKSILETQLALNDFQPRLPLVNIPQLFLEAVNLLLEAQTPASRRMTPAAGVSSVLCPFSRSQTTLRPAHAHSLCCCANLSHFPLALGARQAQEMMVIFKQRRAMRDGDKRCRGLVSECASEAPIQFLTGAKDSLMPRSLACWYIMPSTSVETADVHSSKTPYLGRW